MEIGIKCRGKQSLTKGELRCRYKFLTKKPSRKIDSKNMKIVYIVNVMKYVELIL